MPVRKEKVSIWVFECLRCGYRWTTRKPLETTERPENPRACSRCNSALWDTPRERKKPERTSK